MKTFTKIRKEDETFTENIQEILDTQKSSFEKYASINTDH